jgi:signal transduction histidine kinase
MSQAMITRREKTIFQISSFLFLGVAAAVGFVQTTSIPIRGAMVALLLAMAILQVRAPGHHSPSWQIHLYLGVQATLIAVLMFLVPGWTMFPALYCLLGFQTVFLLSPNPGILWIAAYVIITMVSFALSFGWEEGLIALPIYGGLNAFFGAYANALLRANAARQESQALLDELRQAHGQLQEYALRVEEMAVVEERNRLAREMHDTLGHRLTVASVQLEGAQRLCSVDPKQAASMVNTVHQQVREALSELRSTVATLRTPIEADLRLRSSLRRLISDFQEATGLTVHQVLPEDTPDLPATHRLALFRAVQEALTNIQKHAQATQVWLLLTFHSDRVSLIVSDDGKGVSIRRDQTGFGLRGLRERAAQLGGELYLEPRRGGGTQLSLRLPLPPPHPGAGEPEALDTVWGAMVGDKSRQHSEGASE